MVIPFGNKRIKIKLRDKYLNALEKLAESVKGLSVPGDIEASLFSNNTNESETLTKASQVEWERTLNYTDKLMGIYEIAKLSTGNTTYSDLIILLSSLGIKIYNPRVLDGSNIKLTGDVMCTTGSGDETKKFYAYITMVRDSNIEASTLYQFSEEARILGLAPVIIAPFDLDTITKYSADALNVEVLGKKEMEDIHRGIESRKNGKFPFTDEVLKEVSKL